MLNQHRNLVVPESDLLRVGDCVLDVPRREVACGGETRRITIKSLQVLLVLVAHQGKVVSRETLLEWVWADTLPTDDVLTQAITQLRKAFCDDRDSPRYVETIAKGGYRLLAPVQWLAESAPEPANAASMTHLEVVDAPAQEADRQPPVVEPRSRRSVRSWTAAALLVAGVAAAVAWWPRRAEHAPVAAAPVASAAPVAAAPAPATYQRITSLPGSEMWPSLSPDGAQVVYSAWVPAGDQAGLLVQTTAPVPPRAITSPPKGVQDTMPVWSPNGREIVFKRIGPDDHCGLYVVPASGGEARNVAGCRRDAMGDFSWHPDGGHLIASALGTFGDEDSSLHVLDIGTGQWTRLGYRKDPKDMDLSPVYSPDGRWIAFRRNLSLSDIWLVPARGGTPQRLTQLRSNLFGLAWTPDSRSIVFSRYEDANALLSRVDVATGVVRDLGVSGAGFPAVAARAPSLAFVVDQTDTAIFRLDVDDPKATPERLFASSGMDLMPAVAPDGQQLAYMSDRTGHIGLWWGRVGDENSLRLLEGVTPIPRYPPVWAADSSRMLVIGRVGVELTLYEASPASGRVQRLPVPSGEPVYAEYVPGTTRLLVVSDQGAGRLALNLYDRARTPWQSLARLDDVAMTRVDAAGGRILFTRPTSPGLWQANLALGDVRLVDRELEPGAGRRLALPGGAIWLGRSREGCSLQWVRLGDHGGAACRHPGAAELNSISYDPGHHRIYYSTQQTSNSDIGWMPLPGG
ncbi:MAG: winged helix-turn-helix domain-containing protein [Luteimonas sp.]